MRSAAIVSVGDQEVWSLKTLDAGDCPTRSLPFVALHLLLTWRGMRYRMFGRFDSPSGRAGANDAIRDRFPLVAAKSKSGSVGDIMDGMVGGGGERLRSGEGALLGFWW